MRGENVPGNLTDMPDDQLGTIAVSLVVSELRWSPDVAPAVLDRISRDAVTYPERFDRRPASQPYAALAEVPATRSLARMLGRVLVFAVMAAVLVALVMVASNADGAGRVLAATSGSEASAAPSPGSGASPAAEASAAAMPTFDPSSVTLRVEPVVAGFSAPVYVTDDGLSRTCRYVVEQGGIVKVVVDDQKVRARPFLDISDRVSSGAEQGLHAIAFHPDFQRDRRVYVSYNDLDGNTRIDEYEARPCNAVTDREPRTILTVEQPRINDNGGWIGFGPDGFLYVTLGDGGGVSPGDPDGYGQDKATLLSKVLRVDVDRGKRYRVPSSNPFVDDGDFAPETWAWGLRDPRRASFDRATGDLWIGDVGQDRFEEVDRIPAGEAGLNFGWSDMEGDRCQNRPDCDPADYAAPTWLYDKVTPHCGIVGGYVYRGEAIPELQGVYLFSDFCSGFIWGIDAGAVARGEPAVAHQLLDAPQGFVSFGEADDGELYLVALDGGIYRIEAEHEG